MEREHFVQRCQNTTLISEPLAPFADALTRYVAQLCLSIIAITYLQRALCRKAAKNGLIPSLTVPRVPPLHIPQRLKQYLLVPSV